MITSFLLHDHQFDIAKDALQFYGEARTQTAKVSTNFGSTLRNTIIGIVRE